MFGTLARSMYQRRGIVLSLAAAFLVFAGVWGTGVFGELSAGGFGDPGSESARATDRLDSALGRSGADVIVVYSSDIERVDSPGFEEAVVDTLAGLPSDEVAEVSSFYSTGSTELVSAAMVIAIIVDATIVRVLLVPATMRLLGQANWWAPRPLRRVYERFGISEGEPLDTAVAGAATSGRRANL